MGEIRVMKNYFFGRKFGDRFSKRTHEKRRSGGVSAHPISMFPGTTAPVTAVISIFPGFGNGSAEPFSGCTGSGCKSTQIRSGCFYNLRVSGAFLVSGCYSTGKTVFATVISEAGRRCRVHLPSMAAPIAVDPAVAFNISADGVIELEQGWGYTRVKCFHPSGPVGWD